MSDLIERARRAENDQTCCGVDAGRSGPCNNEYLIGELADEIERLRETIDILQMVMEWQESVIDAARRLPVEGHEYHPRSFMQKLIDALDAYDRSKEQ